MIDQPPPAVAAAADPGEIVVRATRLPDPAGDAAFSIVTVEGEVLRTGRGLDEALSTVSGFSLYRRTSSLGANPTTQGVSVRAIAGSGASRALVTLDGVPQNDPFGGWVIWTALPAMAIADARVVRGAGAGPYGAGALTGVIALDPVQDPARAELLASGGDLGRRSAEGVAGARLGAIDVTLDAGAEHSDGWIPVRAGRGPVDRPLSLDDGTAALAARTDVGDVVVSGRLSAYGEKRGAGSVGAGSTDTGAQAAITATRQAASGAPGWRLQAWTDTSDLVNATATIAAGRASSTPANDQYATPAVGWGANAAARWSFRTSSLELGADLRGAAGESRERLTWTGSAFSKGRKAGGETLIGGVYAEASRRFQDLLVTGGVRLDEWANLSSERVETVLATGQTTLDQKIPDRSGAVPTARLGADYPLTAWLAWRAAAYAGFRPATLNELHRPFRVGNNVTEANPDLEPERLYGAETGLAAHHAGFTGSADVFVNQLRNAITNVTIGQGPGVFPVAGFVAAGGTLAMRENAGVVNAVGLEADAAQGLAGGRLALRAGVSLTRSRVDGGAAAPQLTGKTPALTPASTATLGVRWRPLAPLALDLSLRAESARYDDDLNTLRLRAATTLDARVAYTLRRGLEVFIRAENVLDAAVQTQETATGIYSYGPPRMVLLGLRLSR